MTASDADWMRAALALARRGLGQVAPNPSVGCVLVRDGIVVGRGHTAPGGRPHAETQALAEAGARSSGATAYVTLEPCAHHGMTPPCAEALVAAGISRCVVALEDPDPRVSGRGIAMLKASGIAVSIGLLADEAEAVTAGFLCRIRQGRPLVTLKLASTLDGRIATSTGESQWITSPASRRLGHLLRYQHDAVLVGSGTALADDPALTVRLPGLEAPPKLRIVIDSRLRTPLTQQLVRDAPRIPTVIITLDRGAPTRRQAFRDCGVDILELPPGPDGRVDLGAALQALGRSGLTSVLVEGGATLAAALLAAGLIDRIEWFRSAGLIGGDGLAAIGPLGITHLSGQIAGTRQAVRRVDEDLLETWAIRS
jgi:diaminohydroxyphosphoribosylaminopyrimidine deaminase/5-amino-6-(5-phosphoribosylamino)uracil reductase